MREGRRTGLALTFAGLIRPIIPGWEEVADFALDWALAEADANQRAKAATAE